MSVEKAGIVNSSCAKLISSASKFCSSSCSFKMRSTSPVASLASCSSRVVGQEELKFTREAGSGMVFPSELWHRTERPGGWKLTLFFGYFG